MNIFEIIPRNFRQTPSSSNFISCLLPSGIRRSLIENRSRIPTERLVSILNGRLISTGIRYENITFERQNDNVIISGRSRGSATLGTLCIINKITAEQTGLPSFNESEFQVEVVDIMITIFSRGIMPSVYRTEEEEVEDFKQYTKQSNKSMVLDEDALINTSDFIDKISKCCNDNTTKIIVRYKDNELKIIDTYLEKEFIYIDVINPKKTKV